MDIKLTPVREDEVDGTLVWEDGSFSGFRSEVFTEEAYEAVKRGYIAYTPLGLYKRPEPL